MPSNLFTNFEIQKYYQNKQKFNGVYSKNNLPKEKYATYVINFNEHKAIGTHWIALYVNDDNETYFDNFGVEYALKKTKNF